MKIKKLPDAEQEIMLAIWEANEAVNSDYLLEKLNKDWVKPTLLNLLHRLEGRGFVKCEKSGRYNIYTPLIEKEDYLKQETAGFLKKLHHGSVTSLIASLYDGKSITKDDLAELESYIRGAK